MRFLDFLLSYGRRYRADRGRRRKFYLSPQAEAKVAAAADWSGVYPSDVVDACILFAIPDQLPTREPPHVPEEEIHGEVVRPPGPPQQEEPEVEPIHREALDEIDWLEN